jgi:hypothetical protein
MPITPSDWAQLNPSNFGSPVTLASAATIAPTTFFTVLTGNVAITVITPPVPHAHMLAIQFAGTGGITATTGVGGILTTTASVAGQVMLLVYNPATQRYVPVG